MPLANITWRGREVAIHHQWVGNAASDHLWVFLHEGLGSVSMWRGFPEAFCAALGHRGLVFDRPGYGLSTPRAADEQWSPDFMHRQAHEVLPAFLQAVGALNTKPGHLHLLGHSDGGSIALLAASGQGWAAHLGSVVVLAPHVFVEPISLANIAVAKRAYETTDLRAKLARHHADPDSAFWGWNTVWLHPDFKAWQIVDSLPRIGCPVLAIQGEQDEYGTLAQIDTVVDRCPNAQRLVLSPCGHSPHKDQPDALLAGVTTWWTGAWSAAPTSG